MSSGLKGIEEVLNRFARLQAAANDMESPLEDAGDYMLGSIEQNFSAQGRPERWQALAPSTLARKRGSKILSESGDLESSVTDDFDTASDSMSIDTDEVQARRMQFGFSGGAGRGHSKTPARPFLIFQMEDEDSVLGIFNRHFKTAL